jgi:hypothetical protein
MFNTLYLEYDIYNKINLLINYLLDTLQEASNITVTQAFTDDCLPTASVVLAKPAELQGATNKKSKQRRASNTSFSFLLSKPFVL